MKILIFVVTILISIFSYQKFSISQENSDIVFVTPDNSAVTFVDNFLPIQLLPGQIYTGTGYYIPRVGFTADLQILNGSFIQSVSPASFTSTTCSAYIAVRFSYVAPLVNGVYYDTVVDLNNNWLKSIVELTVSNSPTRNRYDSTKTVGSGCLSYSNDILVWTGVTLPASAEYCGNQPFVPRDVNGLPLPLNYNYSIYESQVDWLAYSPPNGTIPYNNFAFVNKIFSGNNSLPNSAWEIRTNNWSAWPQFIRWTKNVIVYQMNLLSPPNGGMGFNLTPTLDWDDVSGSGYLVQLAIDSNFSTDLIQDTVSVSQLNVTNGILNPGVTYYWKVTSLRQSCNALVSSVYRFTTMMTSVSNLSGEIPEEYKMYSNYPNPFNPSTTIKFDLPKSSFVKIKIYNSIGKEVGIIINEQLSAGSYEANWNAGNFASGIYFYEISADAFKETRKMVLTK